MHLPLASALKVVPLPDSWVSCWLVVRCAESARAQAANTSPCISEADRHGIESDDLGPRNSSNNSSLVRRVTCLNVLQPPVLRGEVLKIAGSC